MALKVLVASDNKHVRGSIERHCKESDLVNDVDAACNTKEAIEKINSGEYNLAIAVLNESDERREVFDAWKVQKGKTNKTPVYLFTPLNQYDIAAKKLGFAGRIYDDETLDEVLQELAA